MQWQIFCTVFSMSVMASLVNCECSDEELSAAQVGFKDCMDEKKASLLQTETTGDEQDLICDGLRELSTGCRDQVNQFAVCRGREFVDNLVAIHLNAMAEVLTPFYPSVDLKICPVFHTPAPEVVPVQPQLESVTVAHSERQQQHEPEPEYQPVTGGGGGFAASFVTLSIALLLAM